MTTINMKQRDACNVMHAKCGLWLQHDLKVVAYCGAKRSEVVVIIMTSPQSELARLVWEPKQSMK